MAAQTARDPAQPVYLVDASIYIFQAHFSPYVECYDRSGNELSAVYGFIQFLLQFLRRASPNYAAVAHDESLFCGFRHQLCPNYKSNRELPDENLAMQLKACVEICSVMGLSAYSSKVYEADDIIGTLACKLRRELDDSGQNSLPINVVSKDKDLAQLLAHEEDCLWDFSHNHKRFAADITNDMGVRPDQIVDFLALAGDSVDCISGVPGVGAVKAQALLAHFENFEGIYNNIEQVRELPIRGAKSLADKLLEHRVIAELSYKLASIVCDVEDTGELFSAVSLDELQTEAIDLDELRSFLVHYQFQSEESERIVSQAQRLMAGGPG